MRGSETITIHPSAGTDRFGQATFGAARTVPGCILVPRMSNELDNRQVTTIVGVTVFAPPGTKVNPTDQVTARGDRWQVDGEPGDYRSAGGRPKVVAIQLRRVEG